MIDLSGSQPFAEGGNRRCFRHPTDAGRCLKVMKPGVVEHRLAARPWYRRLRGRAAVDDNKREAATYRQRAIRKGGERIWEHLPRFHGVTLGPANETDFIAVNNSPAPTLASLIAERGLDDQLIAALRAFEDWLRHTELLTHNLLPHNLVVQHHRLYLIDGIAPPFIANVLGISRHWRQYWVERRIRRMWLRLHWEAQGRPGSWEAVEAKDREG